MRDVCLPDILSLEIYRSTPFFYFSLILLKLLREHFPILAAKVLGLC